MSSRIFQDFIFLTCWTLVTALVNIYDKKIEKLERWLRRKIKKYARAFIRSVEACIAERKGNMFIIIKSPGQEPEHRHNIGNTFKAIARELDSENPNSLEVMPGIYMCYDTDGFAKSLAPCMADDRADKIYYGDVAFYAMDSKEKQLRCLTQREAKLVCDYIEKYRADKLN